MGILEILSIARCMLPIIFKYEASKPLVTKDVLEQKAKLEILLNTSMEIVEGMDGKHLFAKGRFLSAPEDPNIIYNEEMPFWLHVMKQ